MPPKTIVLASAALACLVFIGLLVYTRDDIKSAKQYQKTIGSENTTDTLHDSPNTLLLNLFYQDIQAASQVADMHILADRILDEAPREYQHQLMQLLLGRWLQQETVSALHFVYAIQTESIREAILPSTIIKAGSIDFYSVWEWIEQPRFAAVDKIYFINILYLGVAKKNPEMALQNVRLLGDASLQMEIYTAIVKAWSQRDTFSALTWMNASDLLGQALSLRNEIFNEFIQENPERASALIYEMPADEHKSALARKVATQYAKTNIHAAASWARSLRDEGSYRTALSAVFETWLSVEPDKSLIMEQVLAESDSVFRDHLVNEIALDVAARDPSELAKMITRLPPSSHPELAKKVVHFWKERDSAATLAWITSLDDGPVYDYAANVMALYLYEKGNAGQALSLIARIKDPVLRIDTIKHLAANLYRQQANAVRQMLDQITFLSADEKASIYLGLAEE